MICLIAAALAAAASAAAMSRCGHTDAFVCRALEASRAASRSGRARRSSRRRSRPTTRIRPRRACSPPPATCGSPPASRARPRWRSTGRSPGPASRPSSAAKRCSTGPAQPKRRTTSRPPAPSSPRPRRPSPTIPFTGISRRRWRSARLDKATAQAAIGRALSLAPADPIILFEAGHVAHFVGDDAKARDYWIRAAGRRPHRPGREGGAERAGHPARAVDRQGGPRDGEAGAR